MTQYRVARPGCYKFVLEPQPYWEPAEDKFIIHYSKVMVPVFGVDDGWDAPTGAKTEILPLTRPFGNYAGNVFRGQVILNGRPAPGTMISSLLNRSKPIKTGSSLMQFLGRAGGVLPL